RSIPSCDKSFFPSLPAVRPERPVARKDHWQAPSLLEWLGSYAPLSLTSLSLVGPTGSTAKAADEAPTVYCGFEGVLGTTSVRSRRPSRTRSASSLSLRHCDSVLQRRPAFMRVPVRS